MTTGERIKNARKNKGWTQKQLEERTGINEANIRKYESGRQNPKFGTLQKIADALDCTPSYLMGWEETEVNLNAVGFSIDDIAFELNVDPEILKQNLSSNNVPAIAKMIKAANIISGQSVHNSSLNATLLPAELTDFSMFIEKMGYYITLKEEQYYLVNGDKCTKIALDDLKALVRTSKAMIKGLLDDMMNRE